MAKRENGTTRARLTLPWPGLSFPVVFVSQGRHDRDICKAPTPIAAMIGGKIGERPSGDRWCSGAMADMADMDGPVRLQRTLPTAVWERRRGFQPFASLPPRHPPPSPRHDIKLPWVSSLVCMAAIVRKQLRPAESHCRLISRLRRPPDLLSPLLRPVVAVVWPNNRLIANKRRAFSRFLGTLGQEMKRRAEEPKTVEKLSKKIRPDDYCSVQMKRDLDGNPIWPAQVEQIQAAQAFIKECASAQQRTLIVPDKDADGLSSGVIIHRTLVKLGLDQTLLTVHLVRKGSNIHEKDERKAMLELSPKYVIVLDQGSRGSPPVIDSEDVKCMIIDHHLSDEFPENAVIVSACHYPPIATTSLLTYEICKVLDPDIASECAYFCAIGTHGDLGNTLKWISPFPNMSETFKKHSKKTINDCVSYLNAPRRTSLYDVDTAWYALLNSSDPKQILLNRRLASARQEINMEVERHTHTPPKFSKDGRIAVLKINTDAQVHPVIAKRWSSHLKSKYLEIVMVANYGYLPGKVNFSCRIANCALDRAPPVNIITHLKEIASLAPDSDEFKQRLGDSFARGHKEASGGIVDVEVFEELCTLIKLGEKPDRPVESGKGLNKARMSETSPQKNTLNNYFAKA